MAAKKLRGFMVLPAVLMSVLLGILALSFLQIYSGQFSALTANRRAIQAQQFAQSEADVLRNTPYDEVTEHDRMAIDGTTGWMSLVSLGEETVVNDIRGRMATIEIYRNNTVMSPDFSLQVPLSSYGRGIPIGSIIAWPLDSEPKTGGIWLECNGQAVPSKYVALRKLMSHVPDYRGYFLRGLGGNSAALGVRQEDAMRNITGYIGMFQFVDGPYCRRAGAFDWNGTHGDSNYWGVSYHNSPIEFFKYRLTGNKESGYSLEEYKEKVEVNTWKYEWGGGASMASVIANMGNLNTEATREITFDASKDPGVKTSVENRPLNKAVRYYIKAR